MKIQTVLPYNKEWKPMRETEKGARGRARRKLIRWLFQRSRISGWNGAVFVAALRVIKVKKEKRAVHAPEHTWDCVTCRLSSVILGAWKPERSHEKKSGRQSSAFVCSSTNRPDLVSLLQKQEHKQRNSRRASEYSYKFPRLNHLSQQTRLWKFE